KESWVFEDDEDRRKAQVLVRRFQEFIRGKAAEKGWNPDNTSDLSRVLRVPGTWNRKLQPVAAYILPGANFARRYEPGDFENYLIEEAKPADSQCNGTAQKGNHFGTLPPPSMGAVLSALRSLGAEWFNDYDKWLRVGMALHDFDDSQAMAREWSQWS